MTGDIERDGEQVVEFEVSYFELTIMIYGIEELIRKLHDQDAIGRIRESVVDAQHLCDRLVETRKELDDKH